MSAESDQVAQDQSTQPHKSNRSRAVWLVALGVLASAACLVWLALLIARFMAEPMAMPSLWGAALLALGFQVGFTLCACGLASVRKQLVYIYLPTALVCLVVVGLATGFVGYLAMSGPSDIAHLRPAKLDFGWELERETSGLEQCTVTFCRTSNFGGRPSKSALTITVPRRRSGPMSTEGWQRLIASIESEPKPPRDGPVRRMAHRTESLTIAGQRAFKVVDTMMAERGVSFIQARYWWYSPKLGRLMNAIAAIQGGGEWQLKGVEKMLDSIPVK